MQAALITVILLIGVWVFSPRFSDQEPPLPSSDLLVVHGNEVITDFNAAKKLARKIYEQNPVTFYCPCPFQGQVVNLESCGYTPILDAKRASRVEWEHIVPAQAFGQSFGEWREGHEECHDAYGKSFRGRKCAQKASALFRKMEADLHNLVPAIGEVNGIRSNYAMGELKEETEMFTGCHTKIARKMIEPRDQDKGFVARAYFYMNEAYPGRGIVSQKNTKLFQAWNRMFPPDDWEIKRNQIILKIQKNQNLYISEYEIRKNQWAKK